MVADQKISDRRYQGSLADCLMKSFLVGQWAEVATLKATVAAKHVLSESSLWIAGLFYAIRAT